MEDAPKADPRRKLRRCDPTLPAILGQHEVHGYEFVTAREMIEDDPRPVTVCLDESTPLRQPSLAIKQQMEQRARRRADGGYWRSPGFNIFRGG